MKKTEMALAGAALAIGLVSTTAIEATSLAPSLWVLTWPVPTTRPPSSATTKRYQSSFIGLMPALRTSAVMAGWSAAVAERR